jgi:acetyl esterase/lipase
MALRGIRRSLRRLRRAVVLAVIGSLAYSVARRRREVARVEPDLRNPILYVPLSLRGERGLRLMRSLPAPTPKLPPSLAVSSQSIRSPDGHVVRVVVYDAARRRRPSPALLWIHGGGMVLGRPEQGHELCARWAGELGLLVVSVDYRLAPEDPFPAGLEDCYAALTWVHEHAEELGVDPALVAVGGDSAGGGLAAALSQAARDRGGPAIRFQLLEYPMLDDRTVLQTDHQGRGTFVWTPTSNRFAWTAYLGRPPRPADAPEYAAPARTEDLSGLPPAWIGVGDLDLFHDEDVTYANRLRDAGVPCELDVVARMFHGADNFTKAGTSRAFRDRMTAALASGLGVER